MEKRDFRILVADDDEIARDVVCSVLLQEGYPVVTGSDGLEAIRVLTVNDINLVITDLRMPGADGIEVLKHALNGNPDVAVIIMTAYGALETALEAIKQGVFDYLTKPFKIQELIFAAEKAYKRGVLINENRELRKHLRDIYRDLEVIKTVVRSRHPEITAAWIEKVDRLVATNVLTPHEASVLRKRLIEGEENGKNSHSR